MEGKPIYCYSEMQRAMILKAQQARNEQAIQLLMDGYSIEEVAEIMKEKDNETTEKESKNPE